MGSCGTVRVYSPLVYDLKDVNTKKVTKVHIFNHKKYVPPLNQPRVQPKTSLQLQHAKPTTGLEAVVSSESEQSSSTASRKCQISTPSRILATSRIQQGSPAPLHLSWTIYKRPPNSPRSADERTGPRKGAGRVTGAGSVPQARLANNSQAMVAHFDWKVDPMIVDLWKD